MERRISHQLHEYWQRVKAEWVLPREADFDADEMGDMWDDCFVFQIRDYKDGSEPAFFLSYTGKNLLPVVREDDGVTVILNLTPARLNEMYQEMLMTALPVADEAAYYEFEGHVIKYRQCLAPIGTREGEIQGIIGGLRYLFV